MIEENMLRGSLVSSNEAKGGLGFKGERGYSAYEIAVLHGYEGTEQDWIDHFGLDLSGYVQTSDVVDNLTSTETTHPLSANQGKNLKDDIGDLTDLETVEKNDLVSAINENQGNIEALDEKTTPMYCRATITTEPTVTTNYYITLNSIGTTTGEFSLESGGIKIPSGINHVRISGSVFLNNFPGGQNYLWAKIYRKRGTTEDFISGAINNSTNTFISSTIPEVITNVEEGDIIKLMADSPNGGKVRSYATNTWLMVEKVD